MADPVSAAVGVAEALESALVAAASIRELKHDIDSVGRYYKRQKKRYKDNKQSMVSLGTRLKRSFRSAFSGPGMAADPLGENRKPHTRKRPRTTAKSGTPSTAKKSGRKVTTHDKGHTRKVGGSGGRRKKSLAKRISALEEKTSAGMGYLTYIDGDHVGISASTNQTHYTSWMFDRPYLETAIAKLVDYDVNAPGNPVTNAQLSGTHNRILSFTGILQTLTLRNNSTGPTSLRVYCIAPKESTNQAPTTLISNGFASNLGQSLPASSPYVYPTDSDLFLKAFKILCTEDVLLHPGEQQKFQLKSKRFEYNPILADTETDAYQKRYGSCGFLVRVMGVMSHDATTTTNVGYSPAFVDAVWKLVIKISHQTGQQFGKYKYVAFSPDAQAAGARIGDNNAAVSAAVTNG